jgi:hypothetical protein
MTPGAWAVVLIAAVAAPLLLLWFRWEASR